MINIYISKKPKNIGDYVLYKSQRNYIIDSVFNVYKDQKLAKKIPIKIFIPITSKNKNDLRITMSHEYWRFRPKITSLLKDYYLNLKK